MGPLPSSISGETQHQLALVDQDYPKNRMNDGKCDARGRLWCDDVSSYLTNRQVCWCTSTTRGWGIPGTMCTDSEGRLWRAGFFGATIVLVGPSHRRAVGQYQVPSPSHDVVLLLGGRGGGGGRALLMTSCCFRGPDFSGCLLPTLH